jgi:tRNA(Ile)-lysidine synthase
VHHLAQRLLNTIRKHGSIRAGDRLAVAVSAGADSVALLLLLLEVRSELGIVLSVAHVNHLLRSAESAADAAFVAQLAAEHSLELYFEEAPIQHPRTPANASQAVSGVEAAARALRYDFFRRLASDGRAHKIATAHTLDDQAETLLLRIFRGTGIRGLAGIHPSLFLRREGQAVGQVVRPLLDFRRAALLEYLRDLKQDWREDSTNRDVAFLRNRVRHRLLPLITEEFGDAAIEHMSDLSRIAHAEEAHWNISHPEVSPPSHHIAAVNSAPKLAAQPLPLDIESLLALPLASQRRLIRNWLLASVPEVRISFPAIEGALDLARTTTGKILNLSAGWSLQRGRNNLTLEPPGKKSLQTSAAPNSIAPAQVRSHYDYQYDLAIPGAVQVPDIDARLVAQVVDVASVPEQDCAVLLDIDRAPKRVLIRNWRAGDQFWPAHTAAPKKVKELLNEKHVSGPGKKSWPVADAPGQGLIWMRGFAVPAALQAPAGSSQAILIREIPRSL